MNTCGDIYVNPQLFTNLIHVPCTNAAIFRCTTR